MSAAQKDNETMKERDAARPNLSEDEISRLMRRALDERDKDATPPSPRSPLTKTQWTGAAAIVTTLFASFGGGSYLGVAQLTAAEVKAQDEANRLVVREELQRVIVQVDKRVDADRAEFKQQITEIKGDMKDTKSSVAKIESYILILKDREGRK